MKQLLTLVFSFLSICTFAQTYVWKKGLPIAEDPDSITFVKPDFGPRVQEAKGTYNPSFDFIYLTRDHEGKPVWQSARLMLMADQVASKRINKMALYNHYTISRSDQCPTEGLLDLQAAALTMGYAVVSADYEGFGETGDRLQAYCYGETNARASIDALLAAREWLIQEGYTLGDTIINYGYSQGAQTTVAAVKLAQSEYRGRVHFMKTIAGAGPYDLGLTYKKFLQWGSIAQSIVLPLTVITVNELEGVGMKYPEVFKGNLASNVKSWVISKKFDTNELDDLIGSNTLTDYIQPIYLDSTSTETKKLMQLVGKQRLTTGWTPDADTDILLMHSLKDDIVAPENTVEMYRLFEENGVSNARLDTTSLTSGHLQSGMSFIMSVLTEIRHLEGK